MAGLSAEAGLSLLKSGSYSDFTIQYKDREFNVHRVIICPGCSFFETLWQSSFKEGLEKRVTLPDDDPEVVSLVLVYLYTGVYDLKVAIPGSFPETLKQQEPDQETTHKIQAKEPEHDAAIPKSLEDAEPLFTTRSSDPIVHVVVYVCADKLGISGLKTLACEEFMNFAVKVAEKSFTGLLRGVYENTRAHDSLLRAAATQHVASLETKIQGLPELVEVLQQHEPIVWAIIKQFLREWKRR